MGKCKARIFIGNMTKQSRVLKHIEHLDVEDTS